MATRPKTKVIPSKPRNAVEAALRDPTGAPDAACARTQSKKPTLAVDAFKPNKSYSLYVDPNDRDHTARSTARLASYSTVAATRVIAAAEGNSGFGEILDIPALIKLMREQATAVQGGSLAEAEAMLTNQATALQSLFVRLIEKGMAQDQLLQYETHMRLALRAQSQCRATIEALAAIKNPPTIFAKQANIANGPQQVNNVDPSRARENEIEQSQLSGERNELLPDARASGIASGASPSLEALGEIHRAKDGRG